MSTRRILRNSFWLGLDTVIDAAISFVTSVAIARAIGPQNLSYFVYISWLARIATLFASFGVPSALCKYMAEYLGRGQQSIARAVFEVALRFQFGVALILTTVGTVLVFLFGDPAYRIASLVLVGSVFPSMIDCVSTAANTAAEDPAANVVGSVISSVVYAAGVGLSILYGWGVIGVAGALCCSRTIEMFVRLLPALRWVRALELAPLPPELGRRMFVFSRQGLLLMIVGLVVWDRSEVIFLKNFVPDARQLAFYSVAIALTEGTLSLIRVLTTAISATIRVQYGRDKDSLSRIMLTSMRYLTIFAVPLYLGLTMLCGPVIRLLYGSAYIPAIPVLAIAAALGITKGFLPLIQVFLQTTEQQGFVVRWMVISAGINVLLDWVFISHFAAVGAAVANGLAQVVAIAGLWAYTAKRSGLVLPVRTFMALVPGTVAMVLVLWPISIMFKPVAAICVGAPTALAVYFAILRLMKVLRIEDRDRLHQIRYTMPSRARGPFDVAVDFLVPAVPQK